MALSPVSGYPTVCATISCVYCRAVLSFQGLPAVRYADHLSNEHRILFKQDEVILRTINNQLPGLLPPNMHPSCNGCDIKPVVKLERKPKLKYEPSQKSNNSTQTVCTELVDAYSQTQALERLQSKLLTLDVAVQTMEEVIEKEENKQGSVISAIAEPLKIPTDIKTEKKPDKLVTKAKKKSKGKGFNAPYKKSKKFTKKRKRWCNFCWIKFSKESEYYEHRKTFHADDVGSKKIVPLPLPTPIIKEEVVDPEENLNSLDKTEENFLDKNNVEREDLNIVDTNFDVLNKTKIQENSLDKINVGDANLNKSEANFDLLKQTKIEGNILNKNNVVGGNFNTLEANYDVSNETKNQESELVKNNLEVKNLNIVKENFDVLNKTRIQEKNPNKDNVEVGNLNVGEENIEGLSKTKMKGNCFEKNHTEEKKFNKNVDESMKTKIQENFLEKNNIEEKNFNNKIFDESMKTKIQENLLDKNNADRQKLDIPESTSVGDQVTSNNAPLEIACKAALTTGNTSDVSKVTIAKDEKEFADVEPLFKKSKKEFVNVALTKDKHSGTFMSDVPMEDNEDSEMEDNGDIAMEEDGDSSFSLDSDEYDMDEDLKTAIVEKTMDMSSVSKSDIFESTRKFQVLYDKTKDTSNVSKSNILESSGENDVSEKKVKLEHLEANEKSHNNTKTDMPSTRNIGSSKVVLVESQDPPLHAQKCESPSPGFPGANNSNTLKDTSLNTGKLEIKKIIDSSSIVKLINQNQPFLHSTSKLEHQKTVSSVTTNNLENQIPVLLSTAIKSENRCSLSPPITIETENQTHVSPFITEKQTIITTPTISKTEYSYSPVPTTSNFLNTKPGNQSRFITELICDIPVKKIKLQLVPVDEELKIDEYGTFSTLDEKNKDVISTLCKEKSIICKDEKTLSEDGSNLHEDSSTLSEDNGNGCKEEVDENGLTLEMKMDLPWYEARYHTCLMCKQDFHLGSMNTHVNDVHNLSMHLYKVKFPNDDFSAPKWTCNICKNEVKWTAQCIRSHLRNHNMTSYEYSRFGMDNTASQKQVRTDFTLPWYESTKHKCRICDRILNYSQMYDHLRTHSCSIGDYKQIFPDADLTIPQWKCQICSMTTSWARRPIQQHLQHKHEMTMYTYEQDYVVDIKHEYSDDIQTDECDVPPVECILEENLTDDIDQELGKEPQMHISNGESVDIQETDDFSVISQSEFDGTPSVSLMDLGELGDTIKRALSEPKKIILEPKLPKPPVNEISRQMNKQIWLAWYESKLHACLICGEVRILGLAFKNHIYESHGHMSRTDYKERFPMADIEPLMWQCLICKKSVKWTKKSISDHLKTMHRVSLEGFELAYNLGRHSVKASTSNNSLLNMDQFSQPIITNLVQSSITNLTQPDIINDSVVDIENPQLENVIIDQIDKPIVSIKQEEDSQTKPHWFEPRAKMCQLCNKKFSPFSKHIADYHKMSKEDYIKMYANDEHKFDIGEWLCKICGTITPLDKDGIMSHLDIHAINLIDYERTFEDIDDGGNMTKSNENGPIVETIIDESVDYHDIPGSPPDSDVQCLDEVNDVNLDDLDNKTSELDTNKVDSLSSLKPSVVGVSSDDNKKKGLPWYECKKTRCDICMKTFLHGQFVRHINIEHQMQLKDYRLIYPRTNLRINQYQCLICGAIMAHYSSPISGHLSSRHGLTPSEYFTQYVQKNSTKIVSFPKNTCKPKVLNTDGKKTSGPHKGSTHFNVRTQSHKEFTETGKIPWYESMTHTCKLCNELWLIGSFRRHLYERHDKMSRMAYKDQFPTENIEPPTWNCNLCSSGTKHMKENIGNHLKTVHNVTLEEYGSKYLHAKPVEKPKPKPKFNMMQNMMIKQNMGGGSMQYKHFKKQFSNFQRGPDFQSKLPAKLFQCKICDQFTPFEPNAIQFHLKQIHNMTMSDYDAPLQLPGLQIQSPDFSDLTGSITTFATNPSGPKSFYQNILPKPPPLLQNMSQINRGSANFAPMFVQPQHSRSPWYNKCKWKCLICNKQFSSGFWKHVNEAHSLKKEDYFRDFGRQGIEIVYHWCKICNKKIPWSGASINAHVKTTHFITLKEYEELYNPAEVSVELSPSKNYGKESDKWYNKCEYHCQLCTRVLTSGAGLLLHVREAHKLEKEEYFNQFGRAGIIMRKYKCKMCAKIFPWSGVSISKHLKQKHNMSLNEYTNQYEDYNTSFQMNSDQSNSMDFPSSPTKDKWAEKWYNKCSWTCQICSRTFTNNSSAFQKHIIYEHKMKKEEYSDLYGNTGIVYVDHTCKICFKKMPCNGLAMCKHFKYAHKMTLTEYESRYMCAKEEEPDSTQFYEPTDDHWYNKCEWKCQLCGMKNKSLGSSKKHITKTHEVDYDEYLSMFGTQGIYEVDFNCKICQAVLSCNGVSIANHLTNNHHLTLQEYELQYLSEETGQIAKPNDTQLALLSDSAEGNPSRKWYQQCVWICQVCNMSYGSSTSLFIHAKDKHLLEKSTYIETYGNQGKVVKRYKCQICFRDMKCDGKTIHAHMKSVHNTSLKDYSKKYHELQEDDETDYPYYFDATYQVEYDGNEESIDPEDSDMAVTGESSFDNGGIEDPLDIQATDDLNLQITDVCQVSEETQAGEAEVDCQPEEINDNSIIANKEDIINDSDSKHNEEINNSFIKTEHSSDAFETYDENFEESHDTFEDFEFTAVNIGYIDEQTEATWQD